MLDICGRQGLAAILVHTDLDDFKRINDTLGHAEGARAIREAAELLAGTFRASDVLARMGGDEFSVLLTGTGSADEPIARLRAQAGTGRLKSATPDGLQPRPGGVRSGVPQTLDELLHVADGAMYAEKARKRTAR